jgi:hypothetical protein
VFTKRSPYILPQFLSGSHSLFLTVYKRPKAAFPNILPQTKNYNNALFVSNFFPELCISSRRLFALGGQLRM